MSLLDDVSIVVTPNGYKAGELYAVIPSDGAADMDVTRATAATRVDEDGLVNYAEIIGSELVADGNFPTGTSEWGTGTGVAVGGGVATFTSTPSGQSVSQNAVATALPNGSLAKVSFEVLSRTEGSFGLYFSGTLVGSRSSVGVFTAYFTKGTETSFYIRALGTTSGTISNVSVIEEVRDNVPRIDYTGGGCPHILAEPQRTNLVTYSESYTGYFSNSGTLIYNNTTSPDGLENGAKNYASTTGSYKGLSKSFGSTLNNSAYTLSIFAKAGEFDNLFFYNIGSPSGNGGVWFNLSTGSVGTTHASWSNAKMEDLGNGWYRCSSTVTLSGTSDNLYILLSDADNSVTATASGTDGYYIYGAQLEEGSYATSYIPTSGSTVTRNQDIFTRDGIGSLINSTEGVLFVEMAALDNDLTFEGISISDGTTSNRVVIFSKFNNLNTVLGRVTSSGVNVLNTSVSITDITSFNKIAIKYKLNDFALWINGVEVATSSSGAIPIGLNQLYFSTSGGGVGSDFFGKVKQLQVYDTALTDTQLTSLTS